MCVRADRVFVRTWFSILSYSPAILSFAQTWIDGGSALGHRVDFSAQVGEWLKPTDCKSVPPSEVRRFESFPVHQE